MRNYTIILSILLVACDPSKPGKSAGPLAEKYVKINEFSNGAQLTVSDARGEILVTYGSDHKTVEYISIKRNAGNMQKLIGIDVDGVVIEKTAPQK